MATMIGTAKGRATETATPSPKADRRKVVTSFGLTRRSVR
jgi:hypothetical protein